MKLVLLIIPLLCLGCISSKNVRNAVIDKKIYKVETEKSQVELIANTLAQFPNHSEISTTSEISPGKTLILPLTSATSTRLNYIDQGLYNDVLIQSI